MKPTQQPKAHAQPFVVGIGASAGGLASFEAFFKALSPAVLNAEHPLAFVVVQHLAPEYKSILPELISRYTSMKVIEASDGIVIQANCVYITPPNKDINLAQGKLHLQALAHPRSNRLPIDHFFRSLAQDQKERAICIILSGSGRDGTQGLRDIKAEGGMVMVQRPETAEYTGMPSSAIATGFVDYTLPPDELASQLLNYIKQTFSTQSPLLSEGNPRTEELLSQLFHLLRVQTGHDFSQYKRGTIGRRIERRMIIHQKHSLQSYLSTLQNNKTEVDSLLKDLLIGVTCFFRDKTAFEALEKEAIPRLFEERPPGSQIRVWIPGCSTGEEAYSVAILLHEHATKLKLHYGLQIFATDIDALAITKARSGTYPCSISENISAERLERYFIKSGDGSSYRVIKELRDLLIFSDQDLIVHPPFSKLDLISCRNLLIYLAPASQQRIMPLFHYSLNTNGLLFIGNSESIGGFTNLFSPVNRQSKIFRKIDTYPTDFRVSIGKFMPYIPNKNATRAILPPSKTRPSKEALSQPQERSISPQELTMSIFSSSENLSTTAEFEALIATLKLELRAKEEVLQAANEKLEMSNEELKSANEELQSLNEELQSTNEELETSKEELQSVNEELSTVNNELQTKVADLTRANNDMNNLLAGTGVGTIFVDHKLLIQRFTPAVTSIINLIPTDVGRPVGHIVSNLVNYQCLVEDVQSVLDSLIPKEIEVQGKSGTWYLLRIRPYRTLENVIEGAVITFVEFTDTKRGQQAVQESEELRRFAVLVRDTKDGVIVANPDGRILVCNPAAQRMHGWSKAEVSQKSIRDFVGTEKQEQLWLDLKKLAQVGEITPLRVHVLTNSGKEIDVYLTASSLHDETGNLYAFAITERFADRYKGHPGDQKVTPK